MTGKWRVDWRDVSYPEIVEADSLDEEAQTWGQAKEEIAQYCRNEIRHWSMVRSEWWFRPEPKK